MRAKILNASAGSGKTYQLAYKYVRDVVEQPGIYRHILAVTFTNKATEEMKSRILREIHALASGAKSPYLSDLCRELSLDAQTVRNRAVEVRSKILHDYSRFTVLTIDTFFQRILRAFIKELGIDLNYNVEIETASVLTKSADSLIEQITVDEGLRRWLTEFVQERIDDGRKWDVRDGILALGGELFKEKNKDTLSLARSKEELGRIVGEAVAAATATKQRMQDLATEAVRIMHAAGVSPADFAGKSRSFAFYFPTIAAGECKPYTATTGKMSLTTEGWCAKGSPAAPLVGQLQPLLREICDIYDCNIRTWNTCDLLRENYRSFALLADLYALVQKMCDEQNVMLLSETKYILSEFIGHNDAPFIYEKVGNRYERFMIDEFQDTSVKEWENFLPLLENAMSQSEQTSVLIVGDIKQSIYRWRGGDWRLLHAKAQQALGVNDTEVVNLRENWRSLPTVVDFNNRIIQKIVAADNTALNTIIAEAAERGDLDEVLASALHNTLVGAYHGHAQTARRTEGNPGYVSVETFEERPPVVERICTLMDKGFRPCDIMILVRGATDGAKVAAELLDFKARNTDPRYRFDVMTQEALIVGNAPVASFIAAALRLALNAGDTLNRAVYNHYLGRTFDYPLDDDEQAFFRSVRLLSPEEAFERIVIRHNLQHNRVQVAYLQAIHEQIIAFSANKVADIPLFLRWWDETGHNRSLSVEQGATTIEITTIHKAKGLEKRAVIIPYCAWQLAPKSSSNIQNIVWAEARGGKAEALGRFPVKYKRSMAESGFSAEYYRELVYAHVDNINLLYVALTRAAESLHVFIPRTETGHTVGTLLTQSIGIDGNNAVLEGSAETSAENTVCAQTMKPGYPDASIHTSKAYTTTLGRHTLCEAGERFEFGEFFGPTLGSSKAMSAEQVTLEDYPTARADLRLHLPSQRYFEQGEAELAPRNLGILLHRAFAGADTTTEVDVAIAQMEADATLSAPQAAELRRRVAQALAQPEAATWFKSDWQHVRNENEIILPGGRIRRPDRVMIRGTHAVCVDYKFGNKDIPAHRHQVCEYLSLLRGMGYTKVEGYLWYVKRGQIEKVNDNNE